MHLDKNKDKDLQNSKIKSSIEMQIISAYLDEIHKVTKLINDIKSNVKEFKENGCKIHKKHLKQVFASDKLVAKLLILIKKHVIVIETPFLDILKDIKLKHNSSSRNIRGNN